MNTAGQSIGQLRLDNVEACIRMHGRRVGAPEHLVTFIVGRAKRQITEGGRSGSYAVRHGEADIDFMLECQRADNVVPFRRRVSA